VTELQTQNKRKAARGLRKWWRAAKAEHRAAGLTWYCEAHEFCQAVADATGLHVNKIAGIVAVLSPSIPWARNKREAAELCLTWAAGGDWRAVRLTTYGPQWAKAYGILGLDGNAEPDILTIIGKGPKTRAFYANILRPDYPLAVTVDRWIVGAAGIIENGIAYDSYRISPVTYRTLASVLCEIAAEAHVPPAAVQATIWLTYKESFEAAPFRP
jgi:hypothetical protein